MHSSGSMLKTVLEKIRMNLNMPDVDRYNNDHLTRFVLMPAYTEMMGRLQLSSENPYVFRHPFTTVVDQEYYLLPPCIAEVWRISKIDSVGNIVENFNPRGNFHPVGPGWTLQENMLSFRPFPGSAQEWEIWYVPSADATLHYAEDGEVIGSDMDTIELSASPSIGHLDERPDAYKGAVLRTLLAGRAHEERVITAYDQTTRYASFDPVFTDLGTGGSAITYEIAPLGHRAVWETIAAVSSVHLGVSVNVTQKKMLYLELLERRALKAARDKLSNLNVRYGKYFEADTEDVRDRTGGHSPVG